MIRFCRERIIPGTVFPEERQHRPISRVISRTAAVNEGTCGLQGARRCALKVARLALSRLLLNAHNGSVLCVTIMSVCSGLALRAESVRCMCVPFLDFRECRTL